jgi:PAS domain S-box-containing protein
VDYFAACRGCAAAGAEEGIRRVLRGERGQFRCEYECHSAREKRWFEMSVVPLSGGRGGAVIAHENITERKRLEQALQGSEKRFREVAEIVSDFAYAVRLEGDGRMVGEWYAAGRHDHFGLRENFGPEMEEVLGLIHPEDMPKIVGRLGALRGGSEQVTEYRLRLPDGSIRWVRDYGRPVVDEAGRVSGVIGAFQDITAERTAELERARLAEQLAQAQRLESLGQLAGGVAHDFNNLLTVISGYAQILQRKLAEGDPNREGLKEIEKAGGRAAELVEQLLTFSRKKRVAPQVVELGRAVREMKVMLARLVGDDVEVGIEVAEGEHCVKADRGQLQQVLMNLAANARDAMPRGGELLIGVGRAAGGEMVRLTVRDSGEGMDGETQARIFEPFFTTKETGKGTGLGLATVYGIVSQAGGQIGVESELGAGTTFRIELPAVGAENVEARAKDGEELEDGTGTVLLVDDREDVRGLAAEVLRGYGHRVVEAASGAEAMEVMRRREQRIDVLLTDVVMPGVGGRELAREARAEQPGLRVILMSGYWGDGSEPKSDAARGEWFLRKPFQMEELGRAVQEALANGERG